MSTHSRICRSPADSPRSKEKKRMMHIRQYSGLPGLTTLCLVVLILSLTGCDSVMTGTNAVSATATSNAPIGSLKGSGTETLTPTATPGACSTISVVPALTSSWKIYKDSRFSFKLAIPPGWRTGSFVDDSGIDYIVQAFPPDSNTPVGQAGLIDPEHF